MKNFFTLLLLSVCISAFAQAPQQIKYQGIARDAAGMPIANGTIAVQFDIHDVSPTGSIIYTETHVGVLTNQFGMFSLKIGSVVPLPANLFGTGDEFLEVSVDFGSGLTSMGTSQLLSVPYALYAETAGNSTPGPTGPTGASGVNGFHCWDTNQNGVNDPAEDMNGDSQFDVNDCQGAVGAQGPAGPTGIAGATGAAGPTGANGAMGPTGAAGATGASGPSGANGATGSQGPIGPTGQQGPIGPTGVAGAMGATGPTGNNSANGATGPTGPSGFNGPAGPTGPSGANGINGTNGATGATGVTGPTGSAGAGEYAYIYNTTNQFVTLGNAVSFSSNGLLSSGITHNPGSSFIFINVAGVYKIEYGTTSVQECTFSVYQNGVSVAGSRNGTSGPTTTASPPPTTAGVQNNGAVIINVNAGDVIQLNNTGSTGSTNLTINAGGTLTNVNAWIMISKL